MGVGKTPYLCASVKQSFFEMLSGLWQELVSQSGVSRTEQAYLPDILQEAAEQSGQTPLMT